MAQGSLEGKGGGIGFEGIGADIKPLLQQFEAMRKEINQKNVQRRIHRAAGKLFKDEMVRNIQDADDVVRIRRGKAKPLDIPIGTLNRSVRVWLIDKQQNAYWVGPRVGKKCHCDRMAGLQILSRAAIRVLAWEEIKAYLHAL